MSSLRLFFFNCVKRHWPAAVIAICVGLEMVMPQVLFIYQAGSRYQGFNIFQTDAEYFYLSRVREIYDGHFLLSNVLLSAGKNLPYTQPPLSEIIMGLTGKVLHLDIGTLVILFRFSAPLILFLFIYGLVVLLTKDKRAALVSGAFIILASNLISTPSELWQMFTGQFHETLFLDYARPINPQISSLFFFVFLISYWQLRQTKRFWYGVACLVLFGLSFYVYPYTWSLLLVFLFVLFLLALWQRKRFDAFWIVGIIGSGFIIAIPYALNLYALMHHPAFNELTDAWGLHPGRPFAVGSILIIAFVLLLLMKKIKPVMNHDAWWFLLGLVIAGFIAINNQVITGRVFYYGHYHWYYNKPFFAIILALALFALLRFFRLGKKWQNLAAAALLLVFFYNGFMVQWVSYQYHFPAYIKFQSYSPIISWFNWHAAKDAVVYVPESFYYPIAGRSQEADAPSLTLSRFIVTYTPLDLYFSEYANFYLMPYDHYRQYNLFIVLKLLGVNPDNAFALLRRQPDFFYNVYYAYFRVRGLTYQAMPDAWIAAAVGDYQKFYAKSWPEIWHQYPLNYIAWDKADLPDLPFEAIRAQFPGLLTPVYEAHNVIIYQVT